MRKITFEEYLRLPKEDEMRLFGDNVLNEEERIEVENPLANIAHEDVDDYLHDLGFITLKELENKIEEKIDHATQNKHNK